IQVQSVCIGFILPSSRSRGKSEVEVERIGGCEHRSGQIRVSEVDSQLEIDSRSTRVSSSRHRTLLQVQSKDRAHGNRVDLSASLVVFVPQLRLRAFSVV